MNVKLILFSVSIFLTFSFYSQQNVELNDEMVTGFDGTFQIEIHQVRYQPNIPGNILEIVAQNRRETETSYFPLDEYIRIRILSQQEINNPLWQPLKLISYVD